MGMTDFARTTIDEDDLAKYERLGDDWWDPNGPMGALHKFNPVRVAWISKLLAGAAASAAPLAGKRILDVGCGGGILSESLARLGADIVGIDPAENNIGVAARHAQAAGLAIDYRATTVETLAATGTRFDAVLIMEVIEHVRDVPGFVRDAGAMVRPGGLLVGATLKPDLEELGAGDRRRRIRAALAAAGHARLAPVRDARRIPAPHPTRRPAALRVRRRHLQSADRSLGPFLRHGLQLHAGRAPRGLRRFEARAPLQSPDRAFRFSPLRAAIAQLVRALDCGSRGPPFEPGWWYQVIPASKCDAESSRAPVFRRRAVHICAITYEIIVSGAPVR